MVELALSAIKKWNMLSYNDKIIVGLSGGADSVALLHFLVSLRKKYSLWIIAVHINHGLRGNASDMDEHFSKQLCAQIDVPFANYRFDLKEESKKLGFSIEETGRALRYECFDKERIRINADKIAIAHTKNDQAETILFNFFRGSGLKGLTGIPPVRGNIIRPFIYCAREDIEHYCHTHKLPYRTDSTNYETDYTRNKIRLELIPYIQNKINPAMIDTVTQNAELIYEEDLYLNKLACDALSLCRISPCTLNVDQLLSYPDCIQRRVLRIFYHEICGSIKNLSSLHTESMLSLAKGNTGKKIMLPHGVLIRKIYANLIFSLEENKNEKKTEDFCYNLVYNEWVELKELGLFATYSSNPPGCAECQSFNLNLADTSLVLRNRRPGDVIYFNSIKGHKKIKDFFIDRKIPPDMRAGCALLAFGSEILWIPSMNVKSDKYGENGGEAIYVGICREDDIP